MTNFASIAVAVAGVAIAGMVRAHAIKLPLTERIAMASHALQKRAAEEPPDYGFRINLRTFLGLDPLGFRDV